MAGYNHWNDILVLPDDLIAFAWSAPFRDLAAKIGISDVGLKKQLVGQKIPLPPQGYWNKRHAGKPVPPVPRSDGRRPGEVGRKSVDSRYADFIAVAGPMSSAGPFVSDSVPESLDELYTQEFEAIGKVSVPKSLDRPHHGLIDLPRKEDKTREKSAQRGWGEPFFNSPVAKRQLKIVNALLLALSNRGHGGFAYEHDGFIEVTVSIGDTRMGINIRVVGKDSRRQNWQPLAAGMPLSTPIKLSVWPQFDGRTTKSWQDDKDGQLEERIVSIAAWIIVEGEAKFRNSLREAEERQKQKRIEADRQRQQRREDLNKERLQNLLTSGDLLRQAEDIRSLVVRVRAAIAQGKDVDADQIRSWEEWALGEADKLDPVLSGQFMSHLVEPSLDDGVVE